MFSEKNLAFCATQEHIIATRYRAIARHPVALLGRFLPRLGRPIGRPFFLVHPFFR